MSQKAINGQDFTLVLNHIPVVSMFFSNAVGSDTTETSAIVPSV